MKLSDLDWVPEPGEPDAAVYVILAPRDDVVIDISHNKIRGTYRVWAQNRAKHMCDYVGLDPLSAQALLLEYLDETQ